MTGPAKFCPNKGHDLTQPGAVYTYTSNGKTRRACRECRLASLRAYRRRQSDGVGTRKPLSEEHRAKVAASLRAYHARKRAERHARASEPEQSRGDA